MGPIFCSFETRSHRQSVAIIVKLPYKISELSVYFLGDVQRTMIKYVGHSNVGTFYVGIVDVKHERKQRQKETNYSHIVPSATSPTRPLHQHTRGGEWEIRKTSCLYSDCRETVCIEGWQLRLANLGMLPNNSQGVSTSTMHTAGNVPHVMGQAWVNQHSMLGRCLLVWMPVMDKRNSSVTMHTCISTITVMSHTCTSVLCLFRHSEYASNHKISHNCPNPIILLAIMAPFPSDLTMPKICAEIPTPTGAVMCQPAVVMVSHVIQRG